MRETFEGFLRLRMLAFVPMLVIVLVLVGFSALNRGSTILGIAVLAGVPVVVAGFVGVAARAPRRPR